MTRRLHIAYVCADRGVPVGGFKGASLHVAEMVRALGAARADVEVLAARVAPGEGPSLIGAGGILDLGGNRGARRAREALLGAEASGASGAAVAEAAAVLLNHELSRALEKLHRGRPLDAIYERYSLWSFAAAAFARAHDIPHLLEVNAPLIEEQKRYRELENEALAAALERYLFATVSRVLVPSAALAKHVAAHGAARRAVVVVPNAADPSHFAPPRKTARPRGEEFVIGFVGSLKPWHGLADLARVFRRLHRHWGGYRLLIVGDGPLRDEIESQLRHWKLSGAVVFTGAIDHAEVPAQMERMHVAVAPYPADAPTYFSPIKIFEYMASGVPIVASRVGQIAQVLSHRRTAMLHKPGAIAELAACVEELRRRPALAQKLARQARSEAVRNYTWKRNAARVLALVAAVKKEHAAAAKKDVRKR